MRDYKEGDFVRWVGHLGDPPLPQGKPNICTTIKENGGLYSWPTKCLVCGCTEIVNITNAPLALYQLGWWSCTWKKENEGEEIEKKEATAKLPDLITVEH